MTFRHAFFTTIVIVLFSATASAQGAAQPAPATPDFRVQIWGVATADFDARMLDYAVLRDDLQRGLTPLRVTDDPRDILRAEHALARRIRAARSEAHGGEIFTADISSAFKQALILVTSSAICASISDDNPGDFPYSINETYSKRRPLSTVPPAILSLLPRLPADVQYRFVGNQLILHDTRANVILDRIRQAIRCADVDD